MAFTCGFQLSDTFTIVLGFFAQCLDEIIIGRPGPLTEISVCKDFICLCVPAVGFVGVVDILRTEQFYVAVPAF